MRFYDPYRINLRHVKPDGTPCTARETLATVWNGWLYEQEIKHARETAKTGTDTECEALLIRYEDEASNRYAMWRECQ